MIHTVQEATTQCIKPKKPFTHIADGLSISIGVENGVLWITFPGTSGKQAWLNNFKVWKKPYKRMRNLWFAHAGFLSIWKALLPEVEEAIHTLLYYKIEVRGFSQGGAVAILCHEWLTYNKQIGKVSNVPVNTVVAGCPRVFSIFGYATTSNRCENVLRIQFRGDGVCSIPPAIFCYRHVGNLVKVGTDRANIFSPEFVYHHDQSNYLDLYHDKEALPDNWAYDHAQKIYKWIYLGLALFSGLTYAVVHIILGG
jgi:hypothetical protein